MSNSFLSWSGRADIEGRVIERRCPQNRDEPMTAGDYQPFAKAKAKAAKWLWQAYLT
jgi:hypothetical protein